MKKKVKTISACTALALICFLAMPWFMIKGAFEAWQRTVIEIQLLAKRGGLDE